MARSTLKKILTPLDSSGEFTNTTPKNSIASTLHDTPHRTPQNSPIYPLENFQYINRSTRILPLTPNYSPKFWQENSPKLPFLSQNSSKLSQLSPKLTLKLPYMTPQNSLENSPKLPKKFPLIFSDSSFSTTTLKKQQQQQRTKCIMYSAKPR